MVVKVIAIAWRCYNRSGICSAIERSVPRSSPVNVGEIRLSGFLFACAEVDQQLAQGHLVHRLDQVRVKAGLLRAPTILVLTPAGQGD
jgi:hypothetical protein